MFVQHMLAVTHDAGMVATVMPHGVLFRGGEERAIRAGIINDDLLEAVIGVAPNLFYGTGIPACVLVLRQRTQHGANRVSGKPRERRGKVLFINADREFFEGRAQNHLLPEHIEKIVTTFHAYKALPGFSAIVDNATLAAADFNLNIRRYADNAPPPEPHDVRAHLVGGVPKAEIAAKADLFAAHGLAPMDLFVERDATYVDFAPPFAKRQDLRPAVEGNASLVAKEAALRTAFETWWATHGVRVVKLEGATSSVAMRNDWLASFSAALDPVALLDTYAVRGIVAGFWDGNKYDFQTVMARGPQGLIRGWRDTIVSELVDEDAKKQNKKYNPLDHKLVKFLLSDFVEAIEELEAKKAELDGLIKAAGPKNGDGEDGDAADVAEGADDEDDAVDDAQIQAWKKDLAAVKRQLKAGKDSIAARLSAAVDGLSTKQAAELLLTILHNDMRAIVERYMAGQRKAVVASFENWWDKYRVTLTEIEGKREGAAKALSGFLKGLRYV